MVFEQPDLAKKFGHEQYFLSRPLSGAEEKEYFTKQKIVTITPDLLKSTINNFLEENKDICSDFTYKSKGIVEPVAHVNKCPQIPIGEFTRY